MKKGIYAVAILMTTIVGVGMFGLPYVSAQSGFLIGIIFLFCLAIIMTLLHIFYGDIVSSTAGKYRLPGYAGHYLGKVAKAVVGVFVILGFYGTLLAFIIVGGDFLHIIFSFFTTTLVHSLVFNLLFFVFGATAVYLGVKTVGALDIMMGIFLIAIVIFLFVSGYKYIDIDNFKSINFKNIFLPYGAILYALTGIAAVPEMSIYLKNKSTYRKSIIIGTTIPAVMYLLFIILVVGVTGANTTPDAISGLSGYLGSKTVLIGALFGLLATLTSFFVLGISFRNCFHYDFKINKNISWFLACCVPMILLVFGISNFVILIAILGAVIGVVEGSAIVLIHKKIEKRFGYVFMGWIMVAVFSGGFVYMLLKLI